MIIRFGKAFVMLGWGTEPVHGHTWHTVYAGPENGWNRAYGPHKLPTAKFDKKAYQRAYMRRKRAKEKE